MSKLKNLEYSGYSTGRYGDVKQDGLHVHFLDPDTGQTFYTIWNVDLSRKRTVKGKSKGSQYSGKKFSVSKRHKFFRFWHYTCKLPIPSRGLTTFHDCMGKLNQFVFKAEIKEGEQLFKDSIKPISTHKLPIKIRKQPRKRPIKTSDKDYLLDKASSMLQANRSTDENKYDCSNHGKEDTRIIESIDKHLSNGVLPKKFLDLPKEWLKHKNEIF